MSRWNAAASPAEYSSRLGDAKSQASKCTAAGKPSVTVISFSDQSQANLAVSSGRADLGFADSQVADYIVKQSHGQFVTTGTPFAAT